MCPFVSAVVHIIKEQQHIVKMWKYTDDICMFLMNAVWK